MRVIINQNHSPLRWYINDAVEKASLNKPRSKYHHPPIPRNIAYAVQKVRISATFKFQNFTQKYIYSVTLIFRLHEKTYRNQISTLISPSSGILHIYIFCFKVQTMRFRFISCVGISSDNIADWWAKHVRYSVTRSHIHLASTVITDLHARAWGRTMGSGASGGGKNYRVAGEHMLITTLVFK
jgi:hypothetical protein